MPCRYLTSTLSLCCQGEDGIRYLTVTGVQTCALPILDDALLNFLAEEFEKKEGVNLLKDPVATERLKEAAEKAKIELSTVMETDMNLPFITATNKGPLHFSRKLKR